MDTCSYVGDIYIYTQSSLRIDMCIHIYIYIYIHSCLFMQTQTPTPYEYTHIDGCMYLKQGVSKTGSPCFDASHPPVCSHRTGYAGRHARRTHPGTATPCGDRVGMERRELY